MTVQYLVAVTPDQLKQLEKKKSHKGRNLILGVLGAGVLANMAANKNFAKSAQPLMSDAQLRRRKKAQAKFSEGSAIAGLTGLGLIAAKPGLKRLPKIIGKIPQTKKAETGERWSKHAHNAAIYSGIAATGIGGAGSINFARIQNDEARRRPIAKYERLDERTKIGRNFEAYSAYSPQRYAPQNRGARPEHSRRRRQKFYTPALIAGGAGSIAAGSALASNNRFTNSYGYGQADNDRKVKSRLKDVYSTKKDEQTKRAAYEKARRQHRPSRTLNEEWKASKKSHGHASGVYRNVRYDAKVNALKPLKRKGRIAIGAGVLALGAAGANEYHRRHGGTSYRHAFDG